MTLTRTNDRLLSTYRILAGTLLDANIDTSYMKVVSGTLTAALQNAKIFSWRNTEASAAVIIHLVVIDVVTPSSLGAKIDVGIASTEVTAATLINDKLLSSAGTFSNYDATSGIGADNCADDYYVTGFESNVAAATGLVGKYYIFYTEV